MCFSEWTKIWRERPFSSDIDWVGNGASWRRSTEELPKPPILNSAIPWTGISGKPHLQEVIRPAFRLKLIWIFSRVETSFSKKDSRIRFAGFSTPIACYWCLLQSDFYLPPNLIHPSIQASLQKSIFLILHLGMTSRAFTNALLVEWKEFFFSTSTRHRAGVWRNSPNWIMFAKRWKSN